MGAPPHLLSVSRRASVSKMTGQCVCVCEIDMKQLDDSAVSISYHTSISHIKLDTHKVAMRMTALSTKNKIKNVANQ